MTFDSITLPTPNTHAPPTLLTRLFGRRWIAFHHHTLVCGITFRGLSYITSTQVGRPLFEIPKGYSIKNFIPQPSCKQLTPNETDDSLTEQ